MLQSSLKIVFDLIVLIFSSLTQELKYLKDMLVTQASQAGMYLFFKLF